MLPATVALVLAALATAGPWALFLQQGATIAGAWGGEHIALEVGEAGARVEFDCAHGTLDEPLALDRSGHFAVRGSFTTETGGPTRRDPGGQSRPASYAGALAGSTLTLTIVLTDTNQTVGVFTLTR